MLINLCLTTSKLDCSLWRNNTVYKKKTKKLNNINPFCLIDGHNPKSGRGKRDGYLLLNVISYGHIYS